VESLRIASPDGFATAVIVRSDCGATVSDVHALHLIAEGERLSGNSRVFVADRVDDLRVIWEQADTVKITYRNAQVNAFKNSRDFRVGSDEFRRINIREVWVGGLH
jgi:hypothetical protein